MEAISVISLFLHGYYFVFGVDFYWLLRIVNVNLVSFDSGFDKMQWMQLQPQNTTEIIGNLTSPAYFDSLCRWISVLVAWCYLIGRACWN